MMLVAAGRDGVEWFPVPTSAPVPFAPDYDFVLSVHFRCHDSVLFCDASRVMRIGIFSTSALNAELGDERSRPRLFSRDMDFSSDRPVPERSTWT